MLLKEGQIRIPSGCAVSAVISREGNLMSGEKIVASMAPMHERSNGLGGGFAGYGIYPEMAEFYAFHLFFDDKESKKECETYLKEGFEIVKAEPIPVRKIPAITDEPIIFRYFLSPLRSRIADAQVDEREFVARAIIHINVKIDGAYVVSGGSRLPRGRRRILPPRRILCLQLDGTRQIPDQYAGLVGRRASFRTSRLHSRTQRRDLLLRRKPPIYRGIRIQMHSAD